LDNILRAPSKFYSPTFGEGVFLRSLYPAFCKERLVGSTEEPFAPLLCIEVNAICATPACLSVLMNGMGGSPQRWKTLVGTSPRRFGGPASAWHIWFAKEPATRNLRTLDPSLTLTRTQYPAIVGNRGNKEPRSYAGKCRPVQRSATTDRTLVAGVGISGSQVRSSALFLPARVVKTKSHRCWCRGFCKQYVSSRFSKSLVPCVGEIKVVAGPSRWRWQILWH
jgi:hypothetical protein